MPINLTEEDKIFLLNVAKETLYSELSNGDRPVYYKTKNIFNEKIGLFIKSTINNEVRAYGGIIQPNKNLIETLQDSTIYSHFMDPRFKPLTKDELEKILIKICIINSIETISDKKLINPLENGYLIENKWKQVVLLPWDISEMHLDNESFLKRNSFKRWYTRY